MSHEEQSEFFEKAMLNFEDAMRQLGVDWVMDGLDLETYEQLKAYFANR